MLSWYHLILSEQQHASSMTHKGDSRCTATCATCRMISRQRSTLMLSRMLNNRFLTSRLVRETRLPANGSHQVFMSLGLRSFQRLQCTYMATKDCSHLYLYLHGQSVTFWQPSW